MERDSLAPTCAVQAATVGDLPGVRFADPPMRDDSERAQMTPASVERADATIRLRSSSGGETLSALRRALPWEGIMKQASLLAALAILLIFARSAAADESPSDQASKETALKESLTLQKEVAELQKQLIEAQNAIFTAKFGNFQGGNTGAVTLEGDAADKFHTTVEAYKALSKVATGLCRLVVKEVGQRKVALIGPDDLRLAAQYRLVNREAEELLLAYTKVAKVSDEDLKRTEGMRIAPGAGVIVSTLIDISKLFRTERHFSFANVQIDDASLMDQVALCLFKEPATASNARYAAVEAANALARDTSKLVRKLELLAKSEQALRAKMKDLAAGPSKDSELAEYQALSERYLNFRKGIEGTDAGTKLTILLAALQGEAVDDMVKTQKDPAQNAMLLTAHIATSGGLTMISKGTFRSDRVFSSGGVVVTYRLLDGDKIKAAGSMDAESDLIEILKSSKASPPKTGRP